MTMAVGQQLSTAAELEQRWSEHMTKLCYGLQTQGSVYFVHVRWSLYTKHWPFYPVLLCFNYGYVLILLGI